MMKRFALPLAVFAFVFFLLSMVQLKMKMPMLIMERFIKGAGWLEIAVISVYGGYVAFKMQDPANVPRWRKITWITFSIVFFVQLILGISGLENFLMTGKLHLPIPMMILGGPLYRGQASVMTILFLSTVILTGPAWCSHLCYFGAFDGLASNGKTGRGVIPEVNPGSIEESIPVPYYFITCSIYGRGQDLNTFHFNWLFLDGQDRITGQFES